MRVFSTTDRRADAPAFPIIPGYRLAACAMVVGMGMTAYIGEATAAEPTVSHVVSGSWQSTDFRDPSNPGCSMGGAGPFPGSRLIMGASRPHPDPMSLVVRKTGWTIPPGTRVELLASFPDGFSMKLPGTGNGNTIDILLGTDQLAPWVHGLTASSGMQLSFGGSAPPWNFDLKGTTTVVNAMGDCFRFHQIIGVGAPFAFGVSIAGAPGEPTQPFGAPSPASVPRIPTPTAAPPAVPAAPQTAFKQPQAPLIEPPISQAAPSFAPGPQPAPGDKVLMSWSGLGRMQTRPFHVDGPWELQWTRAVGHFSAVLHPASGTDGREQLLANGSSADSSTSYQPRGGDYYFEFDSSQQWTARILAVPDPAAPSPLAVGKAPGAAATAVTLVDTATSVSVPRPPMAAIAAPNGMGMPPVGKTVATTPAAYQPAMEIFAEDPTRPVFHGRTNLPDGAELMLTLTRPESRFVAQAKMSVASGAFVTERISQGGSPLNPGRYKLEISMSLAVLQPAAVRAVVGEHGERMSGPLVTPSPIGPEEQLFDYVETVQLGGPANAALDVAAKAKSIADLRDWVARGCTDNLDFVNAMVRSGAVTGREVLGEQRRRRIEACEENARTKPMP